MTTQPTLVPVDENELLTVEGGAVSIMDAIRAGVGTIIRGGTAGVDQAVANTNGANQTTGGGFSAPAPRAS